MMHVSSLVVFLSLTGHNSRLLARDSTRPLLMTWAPCVHTWEMYWTLPRNRSVSLSCTVILNGSKSSHHHKYQMRWYLKERLAKSLIRNTVRKEIVDASHLWALIKSDLSERCLQGWGGLSRMSEGLWHHLAPAAFVQSLHSQKRRSLSHISGAG